MTQYDIGFIALIVGQGALVAYNLFLFNRLVQERACNLKLLKTIHDAARGIVTLVPNRDGRTTVKLKPDAK